MNQQEAAPSRPDIIAAIRGGDDSLGMEGEADIATASLEQARFWRNIDRLGIAVVVFGS